MDIVILLQNQKIGRVAREQSNSVLSNNVAPTLSLFIPYRKIYEFWVKRQASRYLQVMSHRWAESNASELSMNLLRCAANLHMTQRALTSPSARVPSPRSHANVTFRPDE